MADRWIAVRDRPPPHDEPVVYARPHHRRPGAWSVGIAYWTVSQKWNPEAEAQRAPDGFTHWKALGDQPRPHGAAPTAPAGPPKVETWPKERMVGRMGDMGPPGHTHMTVMLDGDSDALVSIWQQEQENDGKLANIEFCTGFGGGGSPRTRAALIALMVAIEADNAESPRKQWPPAEPLALGVGVGGNDGR